jgi:hypothetical protein
VVSCSAPLLGPSGIIVCTEPLPNERVPRMVALQMSRDVLEDYGRVKTQIGPIYRHFHAVYGSARKALDRLRAANTSAIFGSLFFGLHSEPSGSRTHFSMDRLLQVTNHTISSRHAMEPARCPL